MVRGKKKHAPPPKKKFNKEQLRLNVTETRLKNCFPDIKFKYLRSFKKNYKIYY